MREIHPDGGRAFLRVDQPWADQALCREVDTEIFFSNKNGSAHEAMKVCAACPVTAQCLTYAMETGQTWGVWGGMSAIGRVRLRRHLKEAS